MLDLLDSAFLSLHFVSRECKKPCWRLRLRFRALSVIVVYGYFILIRIEMSMGMARPKRDAIDWKLVGRRIRELRGFDMNQEEFARRIGVSQNYLSVMERGKVEIGAEILLRISREFDKSLEWLLTGRG
jgi:DNA-binding XRE family transcriptional regulator